MGRIGRLTFVELKLFTRDPLTAIFALAFPLLVLVVLAGVFGNTPDPTGQVWEGVGPMDYLVPGFLGLVMASIGFISLPIHLAGYRERGVLRRFRSSSVPPSSLLASQLLVAAVIAMVGSACMVVFGVIVGGALAPASIEGTLVAFALTLVCFVTLGIALGAVLPNVQAAQAVGLALFFLSEMTAGVGPPREVLPDAMRTFAQVL